MRVSAHRRKNHYRHNASAIRISSPLLLAAFLAIAFRLSLGHAEPADQGMPPLPLGLVASQLQIPADNPMTPEKIELGRLLFFDKRLSQNNSIACATCHIPALAFTDGQPVSTGIQRKQGGRSAPTAINRAFSQVQFWDGRAPTLEAQSVGPLTHPIEHGFVDNDAMVRKLKGIDGYQKRFKSVFGGEITTETVGKAIATFQRTLLSGNSPFDRFEMKKDEKSIADSAQRDLKLFRGKARCATCHAGFNVTDEGYHNLGVGWGHGETIDLGRFGVTKKTEDIGAFKTPTLREIAHTASDMHDGSLATLEDVVAFYNPGGNENPFRTVLILPLNLKDQGQRDLVAFLRTLSGEGWQQSAPIVFRSEEFRRSSGRIRPRKDRIIKVEVQFTI